MESLLLKTPPLYQSNEEDEITTFSVLSGKFSGVKFVLLDIALETSESEEFVLRYNVIEIPEKLLNNFPMDEFSADCVEPIFIELLNKKLESQQTEE